MTPHEGVWPSGALAFFYDDPQFDCIFSLARVLARSRRCKADPDAAAHAHAALGLTAARRCSDPDMGKARSAPTGGGGGGGEGGAGAGAGGDDTPPLLPIRSRSMSERAEEEPPDPVSSPGARRKCSSDEGSSM